jgi:hypothetical protein
MTRGACFTKVDSTLEIPRENSVQYAQLSRFWTALAYTNSAGADFYSHYLAVSTNATAAITNVFKGMP